MAVLPCPATLRSPLCVCRRPRASCRPGGCCSWRQPSGHSRLLFQTGLPAQLLARRAHCAGQPVHRCANGQAAESIIVLYTASTAARSSLVCLLPALPVALQCPPLLHPVHTQTLLLTWRRCAPVGWMLCSTRSPPPACWPPLWLSSSAAARLWRLASATSGRPPVWRRCVVGLFATTAARLPCC